MASAQERFEAWWEEKAAARRGGLLLENYSAQHGYLAGYSAGAEDMREWVCAAVNGYFGVTDSIGERDARFLLRRIRALSPTPEPSEEASDAP